MVPLEENERFGGIARLYGQAGLLALNKARVCVVGVGGVGSWVVEALARSGVGALTLVDLDEVCVTNVNRQLPAIDGGFGKFKVEELKNRVNGIFPTCNVYVRVEFFNEKTYEEILKDGFDFVIDAIDNVKNKVLLISECYRRDIPIITSGAAGGLLDGTKVQVMDLAKATQDPLLSKVRSNLRKEHGFPRAPKKMNVQCVFSPEPAVFPKKDGSICSSRAAMDHQGGSMKLNCEWGYGSATFVTGAFGFAAAGEVVRRLTAG